MTGLKRAYTYRLDKDRLTFHYIPGGRLQAYIGRTDPHSGEYDAFFEHVDEQQVVCVTQDDVRTHARAMMRNDSFQQEVEYALRLADGSRA